MWKTLLSHPVDVWAWPGSGPRCCWRCSNVSVHQEGGFCESSHRMHTGRNPDMGQLCDPETPQSYWPLSHTPPSDTDYTTDLWERNKNVADIKCSISYPLHTNVQSHSMWLQFTVEATSHFYWDTVSFCEKSCCPSSLCIVKSDSVETEVANCTCRNLAMKYRFVSTFSLF